MENQFSNINTMIAVKEKEFISEEKWQQLLTAPDNHAVATLLQDTPYAMSQEDLNQADVIENILMKGLKLAYDFAFESSPQTEVVELFSAKYLYHNLKVLMKMKASGRDLSGLLIDIGRFDTDTLAYVVENLESSTVYPRLVEEVKRTWNEYVSYQQTEAIDVGFDGAYFAHLRLLQERINNPELDPLINALVDFYNVITVKRAMELDKSRAYIYIMMTSRGSLDKADLIRLIEDNRLYQWVDSLDNHFLGEFMSQAEVAMKDGSITASQLERLNEAYIHQLLHEHRLDTRGPYQLLRFIYGKEMEVRNLRLVLLGRANGLSREQIEERMGAIYGQGL